MAGRRQKTERTDQRRRRGRPKKEVHKAVSRQELEYLLARGAKTLPGRPNSFDYTDPHTKRQVIAWQQKHSAAKRYRQWKWARVLGFRGPDIVSLDALEEAHGPLPAQPVGHFR